MRTVVLRILQLWFFGLIVSLAVSAQGAAANCVQGSEYFDSISGSCKLCTNCSSLLQRKDTDCTDTNDTVCSYCPDDHFYNSTSGECDVCSSECPIFGQRPVGKCNRTHDMYCEPCRNDLIYNPHVKDCVLICSRCPKKTCVEGDYSRCECEECQIGLYCQDRDPKCEESMDVSPSPSPTSDSRPSSNGSDSFSALTSALIGIGVVLGIVLFSVVFVIIGLSTSCRSKDKEHTISTSEGEKSVDKLSINGMTSASLVSLYTNNGSPTFLDYRTSLEILKQSSGIMYGHGSNSARSSPKSSRSSSVPLTYYSAYKSKYRDSLLTPV